MKAPFDIVRAGRIELVVTDLQRSREFYVNQLGLVVTEESRETLFLRGVEELHHHSLALRIGPRPAIAQLGFLVRSKDDLDRAAQWFSSRGRHLRRVSADQTAGHFAAIRLQDEVGFPIELYTGMDQVESLLQSYHLHRGARIQRIDHFNLHLPDVQKAFDYYTGDLGFRCSEYIEGEGPDRTLYAAWLYRKPNVHDVALTAGAGPRVHHFAFWAPDTDAIINACDMLGASGWSRAIERGPGRHGVSNAFYLYLRDPDGHRVELFTGDYWTGDPDHRPKRWSSADEQRRSFWGHTVPERWYLESSRVEQPDGRLAPVVEAERSELRLPLLPS